MFNFQGRGCGKQSAEFRIPSLEGAGFKEYGLEVERNQQAPFPSHLSHFPRDRSVD